MATLSHRVRGLLLGGEEYTDGGTVRVTVTDDDMPGLTIRPESLDLSEGESAVYTVVLRSRPAGTVSVAPSSDNGDVAVSPETVTFTPGNWNTAQTVTVTAASDDDGSDETATLSHAVSGYGSVTSGGTVRVTVTDDDMPGVTIRPESLDLSEGESAVYTVVLRSRPAGSVSVAPSSDNGDVAVSPETVTFTPGNWDTAQTVTVTAARDDDGSDETATLSHAVSGYGSVTSGGSVRVAVADRYSAGPDPDLEEKQAVEEVVEGIVAGSVSNVTSNIGTRFSAARGGGAALSLAGRKVRFGAAAPAVAGLRSVAGSGGEGWSRGLTADEMLRSSAFELPLGAAGEGTGIGWPSQWTLWGRGDILFFDKKPDTGLRYDGDLRAGYLGVDGWLDERWLAGVAVSRTMVDSDYDRVGVRGSGGRLEMTLTGVHPYVRFAPDAESELWAILGAGLGEIEHRRKDAPGRQASDARTYMAAAGARRALATGGGVDWALLGDAGFGRLKSDSGRQLIDGLSVDSWRVRLGVEGSAPFALEGGSSLTPFVEVAGRYDGGGDSDVGLEVATGAHYADPASGFGVEARGRALVLHSADNYREYGASLTASLSPGTDGEGLSLSLSPRLGAAAGGADSLWRENEMAYAESTRSEAMSLNARVGYGLRAAAMRGVLTPFGELNLWERGSRDVRAGVGFGRTGSASGALSVELSAARRAGGGLDPEHRADLIGRLRF